MPVREKLLEVEGAAEMLGRSENAVRQALSRRSSACGLLAGCLAAGLTNHVWTWREVWLVRGLS
jgi:hypothetical protein